MSYMLGNCLASNIIYCYRSQFRVGADSVCQELGSTLVGIQTGSIEDNKDWNHWIINIP